MPSRKIVTYAYGPSRISMIEIEPTQELYLFNWYTEPDQRHQGYGNTLVEMICSIADEAQAPLVTHPDNAWLQTFFESHDFVLQPPRPRWEDKPLLRRDPKPATGYTVPEGLVFTTEDMK